ncbi:MAG: iron-sulfur cluster assembly scaffold protein [Desulfobacterales bacterium]|nr:iron-sulfur cluster assembly scaffold protein [Desulfobacterales bacterium]
MIRESKTEGESDSVQYVTYSFLQHAESPCNVGEVENPDGFAEGIGSCGDSLIVGLLVTKNRIVDLKYIPQGCLYTIVSASAMSTMAIGLKLEDALELNPDDIERELGGLPEDHKHCARLAVNTLGEAIADYYHKEMGRQK